MVETDQMGMMARRVEKAGMVRAAGREVTAALGESAVMEAAAAPTAGRAVTAAKLALETTLWPAAPTKE